MKISLKTKWVELQGSPDACVITGALCQKRNGKECYCTAGFLLKAAGYKPIFPDWTSPHFQEPRYWVNPSRHKIEIPGDAVNRLLKGTGQNYSTVWRVNDDNRHSPAELLDFIQSIPATD